MAANHKVYVFGSGVFFLFILRQVFSNTRKYNLSHALGKILIVGMALFVKNPSYLYLDCMNFISELFIIVTISLRLWPVIKK